MSDDFDALHLWLGIPPEERPASHYRLLGLAEFESNLDVIESAVDQRMAFVRQKAVGKRVAKSQEILGLLASARVCLLDPQEKSKYDQQLRTTASSKSRPASQAAPQPVLPPLLAPVLPPSLPPQLPPRAASLDPLAAGPLLEPQAFPTLRTSPAAPKLPIPLIVSGVVAVVIGIAVVGALAALLGESGGAKNTLAKNTLADGSSGARSGSPVAPAGPPAPPLPPTLPDPGQPSPSAPPELSTEAPSASPSAPPAMPAPPLGAGPTVAPPVAGPTQPVEEELRLPLLPRAAGQKWLIVCSDDERGRVERACKDYGVPFEVSDFDLQRKDYAGIHSIVVGSNHMDYWGQGDERKRPESFDPIERFVEGGGHLIVMGSFNGRNMQHMKRFGITTGVLHCSFYKDVPGRTEVLFAGASDVPTNFHLQSAGNFRVAVPHIVMAARADNGEPAVATLAHGKGRVTFTLCEPEWQGDLWFLSAIALWNLRGAPTSLLDEPLPLELASSTTPNSGSETTPGGSMPGRSLSDLLEGPATSPTGPMVAANRLPVPSDDEFKAADALVKEIFEQQLKAQKPAEKLALAQLFLQHAADSAEEPASQYVLFTLAIEQAIAARSVEVTMQAIDAQGFKFEIDTGAQKVDALQRLAKGSPDPVIVEAIVKSALDLSADLVDAQSFPQASRAASLALSGSTRLTSKSWREIALANDRRIKTLAREAEIAVTHRTTLQSDPQEPLANLAVGRYYAVVLGDWPRALPHLALATSASIQAAAHQELDKTSPASGRFKQLGDLWVAAAEDFAAADRLAVQGRARQCYLAALQEAKGLTRAEIESKLAKLPSPAFQIQLHVEDIHGIEELHLSADAIRWNHLTWGWPASATFNGHYWKPEAHPLIRNRGASQLLPVNLDFSTARVQKVKGRGEVTVTSTPTAAVVRIDDQPDGYDDYDILITFGTPVR